MKNNKMVKIILIIIGIILVITILVFGVKFAIKKYNESTRDKLINTIQLAAKDYATENKDQMPTTGGEYTLCFLIENKVLEESEFKNPVTKMYYSKNTSTVKIYNDTYKFVPSEIGNADKCE